MKYQRKLYPKSSCNNADDVWKFITAASLKSYRFCTLYINLKNEGLQILQALDSHPSVNEINCFLVEDPSKMKYSYTKTNILLGMFKISSCGTVTKENFNADADTFYRSQNMNECLSDKISIDVNGFIKNCPALPSDFGLYEPGAISQTTNNNLFNKYQKITKDEIEVCKDCIYRYCCTDCRAFTANSNSLFSKPSKCSYDPYTNTWLENYSFFKPIFKYTIKSPLLALLVFTCFFLLEGCQEEPYQQADTKQHKSQRTDDFAEYDSVRALLSKNISSPQELLDLDRKIEKLPNLFAIDCEKMLINAAEIGDLKLSLKYAKILLSKKCPIEYFKQDKYSNLSKSTEWIDFLSKQHMQENSEYQEYDKFKEIYYLDQLVASTFNNANVHVLFDSVSNKFLDFVDKYGFPSEKKVGVRINSDGSIGTPYYYVIMLHHYHKGNLPLWNSLDSLASSWELDYKHAKHFKSYEITPERAKLINSRRTPSLKRKSEDVKIYTDNYKIICEDTYLFVPKFKKRVKTDLIENFTISYLDWNEDMLFRQKGEDYYAIIYPDSSTSCYYKIKDIDTLVVNRRVISLNHLTGKITTIPENSGLKNNKFPSFFSKVSSIPLENGDQIRLENKYNDGAIIYFYASWCKPCIQKLERLSASKCSINNKIIPIALESSDASLKKIFREKKIVFPILHGDSDLKSVFEVESFPWVVTLDSKNRIVNRGTKFKKNDTTCL